MRTSLFTAYLLLFTCLTLRLNAQNEPTISTCSGMQRVCATNDFQNACFKITIDPEYTTPIDYFEIDWGDGSVQEVSLEESANDIFHEYDISDFYNTCDDELEFIIKLTTIPENGPSVANASFLTFVNPPKAQFSVSRDSLCIGQILNINDTACPTEGLIIGPYNYGDGNMGTEESHPYMNTGNYTITQTVQNECGEDTATRDVSVVNEAVAIAETTNGVSSTNGDTLIVCRGGGALGIVDLDGFNSINENFYEWLINTSGNNYDWLTSDEIGDAQIQFLQAGVYTLILEVDNVCNEPDRDTLIFNVLDAAPLSLNDQSDECEAINYTPDPFDPNAQYEVNGMIVESFPIMLGFGTHTIRATLTNLCGSQVLVDTFSITSPQQVAITFPLEETIELCQGDPDLQLSTNLNGGAWNNDSFITEIGNDTVFQPTEAGSYNLIYTLGSGVCATYDTLSIEVLAVSINLPSISACQEESFIVLSATPMGGAWSSEDCPTCIQNDTFFFAGTSLEEINVNYSVDNAQGCSGNANTTITRIAPQASFELPEALCDESTVEVDISNASADSYEWRVDGLTVNPPPFAPLSPGEHIIEMIAISGNCRDSTSTTITITAPPPLANIQANQNNGCGPLSVVFSTTTSSLAEIEYEWDFGRFPDDTFLGLQPDEPIIFENLTDSVLTYIVQFTTRNDCGETSDIVEIEVLPQPKAEIGIDSSLIGCSPYTVIFTNRSSASTDSCFWEGSDGFTLETCTDSFSLTLVSDVDVLFYSIQLTATNECGSDTAFDTITVYPPGIDPFFNIDDSDFTVCPREPIEFTEASTPIPVTVQWDFGDGTFSDEMNPVHTYQEEDTSYQVLMTVSTGCGSRDLERTINILPRPDANLEFEAFHCEDNPVQIQLIGNMVGQTIYLGEEDSTFLNQISYNFESPGTYPIRAIFSNIEGCIDSTLSDLIILERPMITDVIVEDSVCSGQPVHLAVQSTGASSFQWILGDGTLADDSILEHTFDYSDLFSNKLIAISDFGCRDSIIFPIFVRPTPLSAFDYIPDTSCTPVDIGFINLTPIDNASSFLWLFGDGESSTEINPSHQYFLGGPLTVSLIASLDNICFDTSRQEVYIRQTPIYSSTAIDERCQPDEAFVWEIETNPVNTIIINGPDFLQTGINRFEVFENGDYEMTIVSPDDCFIEESFTVPEVFPIVLSVMPDTLVKLGTSIRINTEVNKSNLNFNWEPGTFLDDATTMEPISTPGQTITYYLEVSDSLCLARDTVTISVEENNGIYFPNAFSPNGDGFNDRYTIFPTFGVESILDFGIYTRWGQEVFRINSPIITEGRGVETWDGLNYRSGKNYNPAVFTYFARIKLINGLEKQFQGDIHLVR